MFEIHDDIEVLKRMGMACGLEVGKCSAEDLKVARSLVPKALEPYVIGQCSADAFTLSTGFLGLTTKKVHYRHDNRRCHRVKSMVAKALATRTSGQRRDE